MNPLVKQNWTPEDLARWGIRGIDDFSVEELARLHQKVEGWVRPRVPPPAPRARRLGGTMKPETADPT